MGRASHSDVQLYLIRKFWRGFASAFNYRLRLSSASPTRRSREELRFFKLLTLLEMAIALSRSGVTAAMSAY
jgi:hypothetical protein